MSTGNPILDAILQEGMTLPAQNAARGGGAGLRGILGEVFGGGKIEEAPAGTVPAPSPQPAVAAAPSNGKGTATSPIPPSIGDPTAMDLPPEARSLLNAIARPESGGAYDVRYSPKGGVKFEGNQHPNIREAGPHGPSSAAGRYQFTGTTWKDMGGGDFTPEMQDRRAWDLAQRDYRKRTGKDLMQDLQVNGLTEDIARVLAPTWQGFANPKSRQQAVRDYQESYGRYGASAQEEPGPGAGAPVPNAPPSGGGGMEFSSRRRGEQPVGELAGGMGGVASRALSETFTQDQSLLTRNIRDPNALEYFMRKHGPEVTRMVLEEHLGNLQKTGRADANYFATRNALDFLSKTYDERSVPGKDLYIGDNTRPTLEPDSALPDWSGSKDEMIYDPNLRQGGDFGGAREDYKVNPRPWMDAMLDSNASPEERFHSAMSSGLFPVFSKLLGKGKV